MRACLETTAAWIRQDSLRSQLIWVEQTTVHSDRECEHSDSPCQAYTQMHRKTRLHVCIWDLTLIHETIEQHFFWLLILSICHNLLLIKNDKYSQFCPDLHLHPPGKVKHVKKHKTSYSKNFFFMYHNVTTYSTVEKS